MIREKIMLPFLLSKLNYRVKWHSHLITMQILLSHRFSKAVRYQLRYGKCIGIRCKIE